MGEGEVGTSWRSWPGGAGPCRREGPTACGPRGTGPRSAAVFVIEGPPAVLAVPPPWRGPRPARSGGMRSAGPRPRPVGRGVGSERRWRSSGDSSCLRQTGALGWGGSGPCRREGPTACGPRGTGPRSAAVVVFEGPPAVLAVPPPCLRQAGVVAFGLGGLRCGWCRWRAGILCGCTGRTSVLGESVLLAVRRFSPRWARGRTLRRRRAGGSAVRRVLSGSGRTTRPRRRRRTSAHARRPRVCRSGPASQK